VHAAGAEAKSGKKGKKKRELVEREKNKEDEQFYKGAPVVATY